MRNTSWMIPVMEPAQSTSFTSGFGPSNSFLGGHTSFTNAPVIAMALLTMLISAPAHVQEAPASRRACERQKSSQSGTSSASLAVGELPHGSRQRGASDAQLWALSHTKRQSCARLSRTIVSSTVAAVALDPRQLGDFSAVRSPLIEKHLRGGTEAGCK